MSKIFNQSDYEKATYEAVEYYHKKNYRKALACFLDMAKSNPKNPKVHEMLVYTYLKLNQLPEAEEEYQVYWNLIKEEKPDLRRLPDFETTVRNIGDIQQISSRFEKLINDPASFPLLENSEVPLHLSILYMAKGEYQKAEEVITKFRDAYSEAFSAA